MEDVDFKATDDDYAEETASQFDGKFYFFNITINIEINERLPKK